MKCFFKIRTAICGAMLIAALVALTPRSAEARWGCGWGWNRGFGGWGWNRGWGWSSTSLYVGGCGPSFIAAGSFPVGGCWGGPSWCGPTWGSPGWCGPTWGWGSPWCGPVVYPPVYVPAENLGFGPLAVQRFMGVAPAQTVVVQQNNFGGNLGGGNFGGGLNGNALPVNNAPAANPLPAVNAHAATIKPVRLSNIEARGRSARFISFGDAQFGSQSYHAALERYKLAAEAAPDLGEPHFRQGHALTAMGRFDLAAKAYRRGMNLTADWPDEKFRIADINGGNNLARAGQLETLAEAIQAEPLNADRLFVLGVQMYFDGQQEKARTFFTRAAQLAPLEETKFAEAFLQRLKPTIPVVTAMPLDI